MAKIKFGMMMTDARGKLGGQVFSKNRAGAFVRTKVTPSNPRTVAQMLSRGILGTLSIGWNALTEAQRQSFNSAVENWQKTDIFGDLKKPTGKNLYVALNKNLDQSGQALVTTAPDKVDVPFLGTFTVAINTTAGTISGFGTSIPAGVVLQVSATPQLNQGVSYTKGKYRVIEYIPTGAIDNEALYDAYVARFGVPEVGANVHVQLRFIASNGQAGLPVSVKSTVS